MQRMLYFLSEAWRGLWRHRSLSLTALLALTGALLVPAAFLVVLVNSLHAVHTLGDRREMIVFLRDAATPADRDTLAERLAPVARQVTFVSKQEAWDEMARELGGTELLEAVGQNPLPASLRVRLRPEYLHYEAMDSIATAVGGAEAVEEVQFGGEWVRRLDRFIETLRVAGFGIAAIIALVVIIVVSNSIRLTVVARRELHRVMRLLGAGRFFLRIPLVLEGTLISLLAAAGALAVVYGLFRVVEDRLAVLPVFLPWRWVLAFLGAAAVLGAFGSTLAVSRIGHEERKR
jgi:cell division transport system permease protein